MVGPASDGVRKALGSYWSIAGDGKFQMQTSSFGSLGNFTEAQWGDISTSHFESSPYYSLTQSLILVSTDEKFKNYYEFRNYILGAQNLQNDQPAIPPLIITGSYFMDATISLSIPYSKEELKMVENSARPLSYEVVPTYNFYQGYYENQIIGAPEQVLPNLYTVYGGDTNDLTPNALNDLDPELINIATSIGSITSENVPPEEEILPIENIDYVKQANPYKRLFPMYNDIRFSTEVNTIFAEIMEDAKLSTDFLKNLTTADETSISFTGFREDLSVDGNGEVVFVATNGPGSFKTLDALDWLKKVGNDFSETDSSSFFGDDTTAEDTSFIGPTPPESNKFVRFLNLLTFEGKVQNMINDYMRSYTDLIKGVPSYSETVAYKVVKTKNGQLITTYLFPNSNEIDVYNFVDTQVKYGETYEYSAFAYQLVLGAEYMYDNLELETVGKGNGAQALLVTPEAPKPPSDTDAESTANTFGDLGSDTGPDGPSGAGALGGDFGGIITPGSDLGPGKLGKDGPEDLDDDERDLAALDLLESE